MKVSSLIGPAGLLGPWQGLGGHLALALLARGLHHGLRQLREVSLARLHANLPSPS
jgi:hypothetical protein